MFPGPLLRDTFDREYQVVCRGGRFYEPHPAAQRKSFTDVVFAKQFLTQLNFPHGYWQRLLGNQYPVDYHSPSGVPFLGLARLMVNGTITFYELPRVERCIAAHDGKGKGYIFFRGPETLPNILGKFVAFQNNEQIKDLVHSLKVDEAYWRAILDGAKLIDGLAQKPLAQLQATAITHLTNGTLRAYQVPYKPPKQRTTQLVTEPLKPRDIAIPAPPPASSSTAETTPAATSTTTPPPSLDERKGVAPDSLDDASDRLESMGEVIEKDGYQAKYSDEELLNQAQQGDVAKERFHVRFMDKSYMWAYGSADKSPANLTGSLGREMQGATGKGPKYWSTTFDQIEDADTDPKLISEKLGLDYEPDKEFVLIIIDTEKAQPLTGVDSVAATFENVSGFSNRELPDEFPKEFTDEVMNEEFQAKYAEHYQKAVDSGDLEHQWSTNTKKFSQHLDTTELSESDKSLMLKRMDMHREIGNNQLYEGNGLTKNTMNNCDSSYGAVETLNFERKQANLQQLKQSNAIKIIELS